MLALFFEGKAKAAREAQRRNAWNAWHSGVLSQSTKIPELASLMPPDDEDAPPARKKTPAELWSIAQAWNAHVGGEVHYRETA